ncbi:Flagellar basal-body rod protein FlgG [Marinobacterium lacunae]|uniref:Flagellar basal-body rod protein FlgG n=1 Tax=Marinobacterium lacunae TaxID=1232683 RepID=A0A081G0M1_9GAMM|nr:flagellar basal-body rod protein FlgG [Marinobacterium lacunae]KEA64326.1 Flagellar basal-body rod protein FlgG [Marinobacterium lacunae]
MNGALQVAKTGLSAQDTQLQLISNNLANVSTVGYKKERAVFEDLLYQTRRQPGAQTADDSQLPSGLQVGNGVRVVGTQKLFTEGQLEVTDQAFDVGISGSGFFQIQQPNGDIAYTRNGEFHLDSESRLVTAEGYLVDPGITLPDDTQSFVVANDGTVSVTTPSNPEGREVGQLELANFVNPQGLEAIGQNLFLETAASGAPQVGTPGEDGLGILQQGMLEGSNVNATEELVNMITTQRAYEINSKVISTADEMLSFVTQQL